MPTNPQATEIIGKATVKMEKSVEFFKTEMGNIRAGRANPQILNKITVNYYGTPTPIAQMANISVPEARVLAISVWDASALKEVNKAILASDLGINPTDDGKTIRLVFPQLTEDRRKELAKQTKKICEDSKIALRNERRDAIELIKKLKKDGAITEDELVLYEKDVQKLLEKYSANLDKLLADKEKEIFEV
ncbi:MAG: ribosome recycling factor [Clostridiales bacterium]|jgi:ribosome recycling factor|nr:ribosome recycling factor [Clostridiales bacterium]